MENRLKEARELAGMTQEELAERSGVSRVTISGIENKIDRATSTKTLLKIASALNTTVKELFFLE